MVQNNFGPKSYSILLEIENCERQIQVKHGVIFAVYCLANVTASTSHVTASGLRLAVKVN